MLSQSSNRTIQTNLEIMAGFSSKEYYFYPEVKQISHQYELNEINTEYQYNLLMQSAEKDSIRAISINYYNNYELKLEEFKNLEWLYIAGKDFTIFPKSLFKLKGIKHLCIIGNFETLEKQVWEFSELETLNIANLRGLVSVEKPTQKNPTLKHLKLNIAYSDTSLIDFSLFQNIEHLYETDHSNVINSSLASLSNLKSLTTSRFHNSIHELKNLESLHIGRIEENVIQYEKLLHLRELIIQDEKVENLKSCKNLKNLYMYNITQKDLQALTEDHELEYLWIKPSETIDLSKDINLTNSFLKFFIISDYEINGIQTDILYNIPEFRLSAKRLNLNASGSYNPTHYPIEWNYDKSRQIMVKSKE